LLEAVALWLEAVAGRVSLEVAVSIVLAVSIVRRCAAGSPLWGNAVSSFDSESRHFTRL